MVVEGRTRTPSEHITWRYFCTSERGRRNSGMPYSSTPPISGRCSNTVTAQPSWAILIATVMPAGPEPTTATFLPHDGAGFHSLRSRYAVEI